MPPPPEAPAPTLPDELLEEVFLRLPPDEPAWLVRCSVASKPWHGLLTGPAFRGRYREFHGAPPMLGFFYSRPSDYVPPDPGMEEEEPEPRFISTTKFSLRIPDDAWRGGHCAARWIPWDCRHGRVLLGDKAGTAPDRDLVLWDPMTGCRRELGTPRLTPCDCYGAAVLCAVSGCDHHGCHEGPFQLAYVGLSKTAGGRCLVYGRMSLQEVGEWSKPSPYRWSKVWSELSNCLFLAHAYIEPNPPVLLEDALHFMLVYDDDHHMEILKYDIGSNWLSLLDAPLPGAVIGNAVILLAMEDGCLGFAHVEGLTLNLWSRQMGSDGGALWTQLRVIDLKVLLPIRNLDKRLRLVGSVEGSDIIFVTTDLGIYEINLKSLQWKKLWKREKFRTLVPFMSFYSPPQPGTELALKYNVEMTEFDVGTS